MAVGGKQVSGGRAQRALVGGTRPRVILLNPNGVMVVCKPEKYNLYYLKYKSKVGVGDSWLPQRSIPLSAH